jgi:hypothetical protein
MRLLALKLALSERDRSAPELTECSSRDGHGVFDPFVLPGGQGVRRQETDLLDQLTHLDARPIPRAAPVTIAALPSSRPGHLAISELLLS